MNYRRPTVPAVFAFLTLTVLIVVFSSDRSATSQSRNRRANANASEPRVDNRTPAPPGAQEVVKVDVDLVTIDALVLQKKTARMVGGLKQDDFLIYEDGTRQEITHFSQDSLPLSVLLLVDRGGCLDPFGDQVHRAAREAIERLNQSTKLR